MISVEPLGSVAIMRLDRAGKKNALTPRMLADLVGCLDNATSARAIVLSGVGDVFCAGFDLSLAQEDPGATVELLRGLAAATRALREAPCPVVASAHGAAIAGGCALLCGCDVVITDDNAKLGYPAVRLGLSPAVSAPGLAALVGAGGPARARLLDPGLVDGRGAVRIGIASESMTTAAACEARAIELATMLSQKPRGVMVYTKRSLNELDGSLDAERAEVALGASLESILTAEHRELLAQTWSRK